MKRVVLSVMACGLLMSQAGPAGAAPHPGLDRSYGAQGVADIGAQAGDANTEAWAAFAGGATVVLRSRWECDGPSPCTRGLTMQRYGRRGELDQAFGAGTGTVTVARGLTTPAQAGLTVDSEGRILASWGANGTASVARFDAAGSPDQSFGSGGTATFGCVCAEGSAGVLLLPAGRLLLHRVGHNPQDRGADNLTLWRLLPDGGLDPSFGDGSGGASLGFRFGAAPRFFAAAPNGSVLLGGGRAGCCGERRSSYVYRVSRKGRLVRGFTANAAHSLQALPDLGEATISALIVRASGRIDLLGDHETAGGGFLFRLRADGRRDRGFGKRGLMRLRWPVAAAAGDSGGGTFVVDEDPARDGLVGHRLFPNGRIDRRLGGALGAYAFGIPAFNSVEAVTLPRGRALVFVGGYAECRGYCSQRPRLVMFREPPLHRKGRAS